MQALQPLINSRKYKGDGSAVNKWIKLTECSNFHCQFLFFFFQIKDLLTLLPLCNCFNKTTNSSYKTLLYRAQGSPKKEDGAFA